MACFLLAFAGAGTSSSVDDVLLFLGTCVVIYGYMVAGLWSRNELVAAAVPAMCGLYALAGNMLPYELGIFGSSIDDRFQENDTFTTWRNGFYISFFLAYTFLAYLLFAGIGFAIRCLVCLLRWVFGEKAADGDRQLAT